MERLDVFERFIIMPQKYLITLMLETLATTRAITKVDREVRRPVIRNLLWAENAHIVGKRRK